MKIRLIIPRYCSISDILCRDGFSGGKERIEIRRN